MGSKKRKTKLERRVWSQHDTTWLWLLNVLQRSPQMMNVALSSTATSHNKTVPETLLIDSLPA